jgi:hypothetical protein
MSTRKNKIDAGFLNDLIGFSSINPFAESIIIENDRLTLKKKAFNLKTIEKLLLVKTDCHTLEA